MMETEGAQLNLRQDMFISDLAFTVDEFKPDRQDIQDTW